MKLLSKNVSLRFKAVASLAYSAFLALLLATAARAETGFLVSGDTRLPIDYRMTPQGPVIRVDVLKNLHWQIRWDELRRKLTLTREKSLVHMIEGRSWLYIDGKTFYISGPLQIADGYPEAPASFFEKIVGSETGKPVTFEFPKVATESVEDDVPLKPIQNIVIDAGHGGLDDPGAKFSGATEKDITLRLAGLLRKALQEQLPKTIVTFTRDSDVGVSLQERTRLTSSSHADLFISLHVNSAKITHAKGVETYFLGVEASDESARKTADFENQSFSKQKDSGKDKIRQWLKDLKQTESLSESSLLAEMVNESLTKVKVAGNRGVRQAMFYVLMGAQVPAILVETGFLSNPSERKKLQDETYLAQLAGRIGDGVKAFCNLRTEKVQKLNSSLKEKKI